MDSSPDVQLREQSCSSQLLGCGNGQTSRTAGTRGQTDQESPAVTCGSSTDHASSLPLSSGLGWNKLSSFGGIKLPLAHILKWLWSFRASLRARGRTRVCVRLSAECEVGSPWDLFSQQQSLPGCSRQEAVQKLATPSQDQDGDGSSPSCPHCSLHANCN